MKQINIFIAGGSGFWSEHNHYPAILQLKKEGIKVKIVAICDTKDPYKESDNVNLKKILSIDKPSWIFPNNTTFYDLEKQLNSFIKTTKIDVVIVSTNPIYHYVYSKWAIKHLINVLCDKPLVVTKNASSDVKNAKRMQAEFEEIEKMYIQATKKRKNYIFCTPLRRRALTPFVKIAQEIEKIYIKTGEGIRYMNLIVNGGLHRYPIEFLKGGAHGYLDGVGALAHSSYHYIDIICWYLQLAKGDISKIKIEMPYVLRVRDYINIKGYHNIQRIIEGENMDYQINVPLPQNILNCELDFDFNLHLLNSSNHSVGLISYVSHHTSYSPRLVRYNPKTIDPAHDKNGGRMSQLYMEIHQGPMQSWQLFKNDVVFHGNNIDIIGRQHPIIGRLYEKETFNEAYETNTVSPKDLLKFFIKHSVGINVPPKYLSLLSTINNQKLTNKVFTKFYEIIAEEYEKKNKINKNNRVNKIIELSDYI